MENSLAVLQKVKTQGTSLGVQLFRLQASSAGAIKKNEVLIYAVTYIKNLENTILSERHQMQRAMAIA